MQARRWPSRRRRSGRSRARRAPRAAPPPPGRRSRAIIASASVAWQRTAGEAPSARARARRRSAIATTGSRFLSWRERARTRSASVPSRRRALVDGSSSKGSIDSSDALDDLQHVRGRELVVDEVARVDHAHRLGGVGARIGRYVAQLRDRFVAQRRERLLAELRVGVLVGVRHRVRAHRVVAHVRDRVGARDGDGLVGQIGDRVGPDLDRGVGAQRRDVDLVGPEEHGLVRVVVGLFDAGEDVLFFLFAAALAGVAFLVRVRRSVLPRPIEIEPPPAHALPRVGRRSERRSARAARRGARARRRRRAPRRPWRRARGSPPRAAPRPTRGACAGRPGASASSSPSAIPHVHARSGADDSSRRLVASSIASSIESAPTPWRGARALHATSRPPSASPREHIERARARYGPSGPGMSPAGGMRKATTICRSTCARSSCRP